MQTAGHNALLIHLLISALCTLFACLLGFPTYFLFLYLFFLNLLVHGQVTIIFVVSVGLSVCLFVYAEFFLSRL